MARPPLQFRYDKRLRKTSGLWRADHAATRLDSADFPYFAYGLSESWGIFYGWQKAPVTVIIVGC